MYSKLLMIGIICLVSVLSVSAFTDTDFDGINDDVDQCIELAIGQQIDRLGCAWTPEEQPATQPLILQYLTTKRVDESESAQSLSDFTFESEEPLVGRSSFAFLEWNAPGAHYCIPSWKVHRKIVKKRGKERVRVPFMRTFELTCVSGSEQVTKSVQVGTQSSFIQSFTVDKKSIESKGDVVLSWKTQGMDSCSASGGWGGAILEQSDATTVSQIKEDTDFVLTCKKGDKEFSKKISVRLKPKESE